MDPIAVIPLKSFEVAKERLAGALAPEQRAILARATADHVVASCRLAGFDLVVVTGDPTVARWADERAATIVADPGSGLDAACNAGIALNPSGWVVVHGDLPLLQGESMEHVRSHLAAERGVIAPARDGGTNVLGATRRVELGYGPGSFHRHLRALAGHPAIVLTGPDTAIEIDTPGDLIAAATLPGGGWLSPFLS